MKALIQKVLQASVTVDGRIVSSIGRGLLVFVGFSKADTEDRLKDFAAKILNLRCFETSTDHFGDSVIGTQGELLIVSQFTLYADCHKGRRPSFTEAARSEVALPLYDKFIQTCKDQYSPQKIQAGVFGADMKVALVNDGPITLEIII